MSYPVLVFDQNMNYLAQIDDYEYLRWTRRWRKPHSWELHINRHKPNAAFLQEDHFIAVQRGGRWRAGRVAYREVGLTQGGKMSENWNIQGSSLDGVFYDRLALHLTREGTGYDDQNGDAESAMRHYVEVNCIFPVDPARTVPFLELEPYMARGPAVQTRGRYQTVAQLLEDISLASGMGYETRIDLEAKRFEFCVLEGRDLSPNQTENPPVIFSPEFDNVRVLSFRSSKLDSKNVAYVAGAGEAQDRLVLSVGGGPVAGYDRREVFIDARDLETPEQLVQRGNERLAEFKEEVVMEVEHLPSGPFRYMVDFDLGDIVHARYPGVGSMDSRIIEVEEEVTPELGDTFKLVIGKEWPDLIKVLRADRRNLEVGVRR